MTKMWKDGHLEEAEGCVAPVDSGWGVFTTVGCDLGQPLLWLRHRARLQTSLGQLGDDGETALPDAPGLSELLAANNLAGHARLRVVARRPARTGWTVEAEVSRCRCDGPESRPVWLEIERWPAAPPLIGHKSLSRMAWDLARQRATSRGADDALLVDHSGSVLETAISNVWVVRDGVVATPPAPECCLPGVMRGWLLEELAGSEFSTEVRRISEDEMALADEIWVSNSIVGVRRVGRLENSRWEEWPVFDRLRRIGIPAPGWPSSGRVP